MKCSILGADQNILCQISELRKGFEELGHTHTDDIYNIDNSFVFVGNPPYDKYLDLRHEKKVIFNVLDTCPHCLEHNEIIKRLTEQPPRANKVTTISKTVAAELREKCSIDAEVIYYPMKPVFHTGVKKYPQFKVLCVGRICDPNKRFVLAARALIAAGYNEDEIAIVGPENPRYGTYLGEVSDEVLNDLYNSVDYVMMTSRNEGIGLPAIEGTVCGAIPIVLSDLSTFDEFWVQSPLGLHYQQLNSINDIAKLIRNINDNKDWKEEIKQDLLGYSELFFRPKFNRKEVAKKIIGVYHTI